MAVRVGKELLRSLDNLDRSGIVKLRVCVKKRMKCELFSLSRIKISVLANDKVREDVLMPKSDGPIDKIDLNELVTQST